MDPDEHAFTQADTFSNGYWKMYRHQPTQESLRQPNHCLSREAEDDWGIIELCRMTLQRFSLCMNSGEKETAVQTLQILQEIRYSSLSSWENRHPKKFTLLLRKPQFWQEHCPDPSHNGKIGMTYIFPQSSSSEIDLYH